MSYTILEPAVHREGAVLAAEPRSTWKHWPKWCLILLLVLWLAETGASLLISHSSLKGKLTARLESDFGRPVKVGSYGLSLWDGPTLEARSVTVSEDPRFGNEYFLYSESLTFRLRWQGLLRGRVELGTLSLTQPSLNIVRNAAGEWNIASWLPRASGTAALGGAARPSRVSLQKIEFDGGRINFKGSDVKLPLAFIGVAGTVETDLPGRWRIDLQAVPWRAAEIVQQAGTIHVAGRVGGTSSRLLPAALDLSWSDASIPDVLRLLQGYDHGIRGNLALQLNARTEGETWLLQGRAELQELHRWDLASRPDNPPLNVQAKMKLLPSASGVELTDGALEGPASNARASGLILWAQPSGKSERRPASDAGLEVSSAAIDLGDVLSWIRAFHSGVADDVALRGSAGVDARFSGWPAHLANATVTSSGAELTGEQLRVPVRLGTTEIRYQDQRLSILPATLSFGSVSAPSSGYLRGDVTPVRASNGGASDIRIRGNVSQVRDLIATAGAFGWNISSGWQFEGPLRCDLRWRWQPPSWPPEPVGFVELGSAGSATADKFGASLHAPFLNQPVQQLVARADWKPNSRHVAVGSAAAFGAHWKGTLDRNAREGWQFALSADHVASADLDRWLNPRWRESFLYRVLPFLDSRNPGSAVPENLRATGSISLDQFTLASLTLHRLGGKLRIDGRHIQLSDAEGQLYGGQVSGSFDANLQAAPQYNASLVYEDVDLSSLSKDNPSLSGLFDGLASGDATFTARGATRDDLVGSLECQGAVQTRGLQLRMIDLTESLQTAARQAGTSTFLRASASFACGGDRRLQFKDVVLSGSGQEIEGSGSFDFDHTLDFRLHGVPEGAVGPHATQASNEVPVSRSLGGTTYRLSGPLSAPGVTLITQTPPSRRP